MQNLTPKQAEILNKLGIKQLKPMQEEALNIIDSKSEVVLLSPTGTGKTLAFLLPLIEKIKAELNEVQLLILVPSRELAIQIEQVIRSMGAGIKANALYGGRAGSQDKIDLKQPPSLLIGTPGRIADHLRRETFNPNEINTIVLDEFDKSLEVGFEKEMKEIMEALPNVQKRILTSATQRLQIPEFVGVSDPYTIDYLHEAIQKLEIRSILSPIKDKSETLVAALKHLGSKPGIVFCNFKDTIQYLSDFLNENQIDHGCFYGGMEQRDRERALIKFRNGTHQLLIATDLAARGLDIPELEYIIHYQLPLKEKEFIHRNGRTARMNAAGRAYVMQWVEEVLPPFIGDLEEIDINEASAPEDSKWVTLYISGGRRDKISKGDIAGLFMKQGGLTKDELGIIELKPDCAFVGIAKNKVQQVIDKTNNSKLKKKKVRVSEI